MELDYLLRESDAVLIHTPLTSKTHYLINEEKLRLMKPTAILVNTARGSIIDCEALYKALRGGWIASATLDVVEGEPLKPQDKLLLLENLQFTPSKWNLYEYYTAEGEKTTILMTTTEFYTVTITEVRATENENTYYLELLLLSC